MISTMIKSSAVLSGLIVLVALFFNYKTFYDNQEELLKVIHAMEKFEQAYQPITRRPRVAVGFGGCVDIISSAIDVLLAVNASQTEKIFYEDNVNWEAPEILHSLDDVEKTFTSFFRKGAAAERYVHNSTLFKMIEIAASKALLKPFIVGGNAPVIANRLAKEGCDVLLGAKLSKELTRQLHKNVQVLSNVPQTDQNHVILEYKVGDVWGDHVAPRANRFIVHRDQDNAVLGSLELLQDMILEYKPDLLVLGGLQMMDRFPFMEGQRSLRLNAMKKFLATLPRTTRIHFELASFVDKDLMMELTQTVLPYTDSLGMNEQELPNLVSILEDGQITEVSTAYPRVASMLDHLRRVWQILESAPLMDGTRHISRLHLHTLAYQVVMTRKYRKEANDKSPMWTNTRRATVKASLVAYRHACGDNDVDIEKSKILMDDSFSMFGKPNSPRVHFNSTEPVACWKEGAVDVCVAPVLVCTKVKQTCGGGDNITGAALALQLLREEENERTKRG